MTFHGAWVPISAGGRSNGFPPPKIRLEGRTLWLLLALAAASWTGCGSDPVRPRDACVVSADSLDFGAVFVGGSRTLTLFVHNLGSEERLLAPAVSDSNFSLGSPDTSGWRLAPGDSLALLLTFSPRAEGVRRGRLHLSAGSCPEVTLLGRTRDASTVGVFPLRGDEEPMAVAVSPSGFIFVSVETWDVGRSRYGFYTTLRTLNPDGSYHTSWGNEQAKAPQGIAALPDGRIAMADPGWNRVTLGTPGRSRMTRVGVDLFTPGRFGSLDDIAVDPRGSVYVADKATTRIHRLDLDGGFITNWSCQNPRRVLADGLGHVYVNVETKYYPTSLTPPGLIMFSDSGGFLVRANNTHYFDGMSLDAGGWILGGWFRGIDRFAPDLATSGRWSLNRAVLDVAAGAEGTVYALVEDSVLVCSPEGAVVEAWPALGNSMAAAEDGSLFILSAPAVRHYARNGTLLGEWTDARIGTGADRLDLGPGTVYIADTGAASVQVFDRDGDFRRHFGNDETEDGWCIQPTDVAVDGWGHIYTVDTGNNRVQKFDADGNFLAKWGRPGSGPGEFDTPRGIAVQRKGRVFVWDTGNRRIQVFEPDGAFVRAWRPVYDRGEIAPWPNSLYWHRSSAPRKACGFSVSEDGVVYIPDWSRHCIVEFDTRGSVLGYWGTEGGGRGQFSFPSDVEVGYDGSLWVLDTWNKRIQHFVR